MPQSKFSGDDRRKFIRIPFWFITKYRISPHNVDNRAGYQQGIGKNISIGGICFEAKDRFNHGDVLEVEIDMPALDHAVCVVGKVAWGNAEEDKNDFIYGLEFIKIKTEDIEAVKRIIETFS